MTHPALLSRSWPMGLVGFGLALAILLAAPTVGHAQSGPAPLGQLVQQLQARPGDDALRGNIIQLAMSMKPAPAIPDEAERRMVRGAAAFKSAQSAPDYQNAVKEFEQATLAAPWYGDAYYNLAVAQDKAEQYDLALRSLKLALLASPGSKEIKDLGYQVEYRRDQANSPEQRVQREVRTLQSQFADLVAKLDNTSFSADILLNGDRNIPMHFEMRFFRDPRSNLLKCHRRSRLKSFPDLADSDLRDNAYVYPAAGREFMGCVPSGGKLSADGQSITDSNSDVWHRQ